MKCVILTDNNHITNENNQLTKQNNVVVVFTDRDVYISERAYKGYFLRISL